jgi:thiol-disulfide isomerase/thioredoxin
MRRLIIKSAVFLFLIVSIFQSRSYATDTDFEIPDGLVWLNSQSPLKVSGFKGKFVVVYFWNYGGVSIQSVVDQCRELQEKYANELVVISVHTGKALDSDDLNGKVAEALAAYRIQIPVAIDNQLQTLQLFHTERWPSAVLFSPDGKVLFRKTGDQDLFYLFNKLIARNLPRFESTLDKHILNFQNSEPKVIEPAEEKAANLTVSTSSEKFPVNELINSVLDDKSLNDTVKSQKPDAAEPVEIKPKTDIPDVLFEKQMREVLVDPKKFKGEKIYIGREYSHKVGQVKLSFRLPDDGKLLGEQQSYVRVYTEERDIVSEGVISDLDTELNISQDINSKKMYIEVVLYFCTKGQKAICRIKSMLFVIPLADFDKTENILLEQEISGESL